MPRRVFNEDETAILTWLWRGGMPARDIGEVLQMSDSAVIGKARRIELPLRRPSYTARRLDEASSTS